MHGRNLSGSDHHDFFSVRLGIFVRTVNTVPDCKKQQTDIQEIIGSEIRDISTHSAGNDFIADGIIFFPVLRIPFGKTGQKKPMFCKKVFRFCDILIDF